jgi:hypothetical protein
MNSYETIKSVMNNIGFSEGLNINFDTNSNYYAPLQLFVDNNNYINNKNYIDHKKNKFSIPLKALLSIDSDYKYILPYDILLEDNCPQGLFCPYKTDPMKCPYNHHDVKAENNILHKGDVTPVLLCRYERPWRQSNGNPVVCMNPYCWYNHIKGRAERMHNQIYYDYKNKK